MPTFRITYRPELSRPPEDVEADFAHVESSGNVVLRQVVPVAGLPREVVVRRLAGKDVLNVDLR